MRQFSYKIFSVILSLMLVLTLFPALPAGAASITSTDDSLGLSSDSSLGLSAFGLYATDTQIVENAKTNLSIHNANDIRGNITLPEELDGAVISWSSDDEAIISTQSSTNTNYDPTPAGVVTRQAQDEAVTLTATITSGLVSGTKDFALTVKKAPAKNSEELNYDGYLFTHFTGTEQSSDDEQIYFALSEDGYNWKDLNNYEPILRSDIGEEGVRDPYIVRSYEGDKFYLLATDLSVYSRGGWKEPWPDTNGSRDLIIWESYDLVNWEAPRAAEVAFAGAGCAWAPEAIYDDVTGEYVVFWSSSSWHNGTRETDVYYSKTRDFYDFTEPEMFVTTQVNGSHFDTIDTSIISADGYYYRASRDAQITIERADRVLDEWEVISNLDNLGFGLTGSNVEGPEFFKINGEEKWCMLVDQYAKGIGYLPIETTDLGDTSGSAWRILDNSEYNFGALKKRHGMVLPITAEEYQEIFDAYGSDDPINTDPEEHEAVLEYNFEQASPSTMTDSKGSNHGSLFGGTSIVYDAEKDSDVLYLNGTTNTYAEFPVGFFDGRNTFTISMDVKSEMNNENFFTWCMGQDVNRYMFLSTKTSQIRNAITAGSYSQEQAVKADVTTKNIWTNITIVVTPTNMKLYIDGRLKDENSNITINTGNLGNNVISYLGKSFYPLDGYFKGSFDNILVYNRELSSGEVKNGVGVEKDILEIYDELDIPNASNIMDNITLLDNLYGADISWISSDENIISTQKVTSANYFDTPAGVVTRGSSDTVVTLDGVISKGSQSMTKTFTLTVKAKVEQEPYAAYLYSYFYELPGQQGKQDVFFAVSKDGVSWSPLNDSQAVLTSNLGDRKIRDPYIFRSKDDDKFYLIATDLNIYDPKYGNNWGLMSTQGSTSLIIWESTDFVNWTQERSVDVSGEWGLGNAWAPAAVYDNATGEYLVFWSSRTAEDNYAKHRIMVSKTRDFYSFSEPEVYSESPNGNIDADIYYESTSDQYFRLIKDDSANYVSIESSDHLLATDNEASTVSIGSKSVYNRGSHFVRIPNDQPNGLETFTGFYEGPTTFKFNDREEWCVMLDEYGGATRGYIPFITDDLSAPNNINISENNTYIMPVGAKHGSMIPLTQTEYDALYDKWAVELQNPAEIKQEQPILLYDFEETLSGTTIHDSSGSNDGTLYGNATYVYDNEKQSNVLYLDGTSSTYAELPVGLFDGRREVTISMDMKVENTGSYHFDFAVGKDTSRHLFMRVRNNEISSTITANGNTDERKAALAQSGMLNQWHNISIVMQDHTMELYVNGELAGRNDYVRSITDLGDNLISYIGKSFYNDPTLKGYADNIMVYNYAKRPDVPDPEKVLVNISGVSIDGGEYSDTAYSYSGQPIVKRDDNSQVVTDAVLDVVYEGRGQTSYAPSSQPPINGGDYTLKISVADSDDNYTGTLSLDYRISSREVIVKADNLTLNQGDKIPALAVHYFGFIAGDSAENALLQKAIAFTSGNTTLPTSAEIGFVTQALLDDRVKDNYYLTHEKGILKVVANDKYGSEILQVISPQNTIISDDVLAASVEEGTKNVLLDLVVSPDAVWKVYKDVLCTTEVFPLLELEEGNNLYYILVIASDGSQSLYTIIINLPESQIAVPNPGPSTSTGGGGSSGGGSSGGGSRMATDTAAKASGSGAKITTTVTQQGENIRLLNPTNITHAELQKLADKLGEGGKLHADTIKDNVVEVRIKLTKSSIKGDLNLSASSSSKSAKLTENLFKKWFSNDLMVVSLEQKDFGSSVEIAVKLNESLSNKPLEFYNYNKETNSFKRIDKSDYRTDKNGYVHFTSPTGGSIVISDGVLSRK